MPHRAPAAALAAALTIAGGCGSQSHKPLPPGAVTGPGYTISGLPKGPAHKRPSTTPSTTTGPTTVGVGGPAASIPKPKIVQDPIPFPDKRKAEMAAYAQRHYGMNTYKLSNPQVIVIHYTETPDLQSTFNTFAPDVPDSELHELPGTCAHFVIDQSGVIHQLVPLDIMCRHTVGLNWTAIGIEHVGSSDQQVLGDRAQVEASLQLTHWLMCQYGIQSNNVIGHNESLSSPLHHEHVAALRTQTHDDFHHSDMQIYRSRLSALGSCTAP